MIKKVFKFGGASVKDADSVRNLKSIIEREDRDNLLIVISAMGKTTSIIEKTLKRFRDNDGHLEITALRELMCYHEDIMTDLFNGNTQHPVFDTVANIFIDLFCNLQETGFQYDYQYDQTVSFGEVLSTTIISAFLNDNGIKNTLLDARDYIITDHNFRSANIDWDESRLRIQKLNNEHNGELLITQGFIASSTKPVVTTTLGREGSDYSAAIFANLLDAKEMTVWKDVDGIRNADPKRFPSSEKIPHLSYSEATELTFYGASVLHPKTTKPLQNKNIPLKVRSFIDASLPPTIIDSCEEFIHYAPSFIVKDNQMLVTIRPRDFSFMNEQNLAKLNQLIDSLEQSFLIKYNIGLQLFTIRHYTEGIERQFIQGRKIFIEQRSRSTLQLVLGHDDASK